MGCVICRLFHTEKSFPEYIAYNVKKTRGFHFINTCASVKNDYTPVMPNSLRILSDHLKESCLLCLRFPQWFLAHHTKELKLKVFSN